jgi:hypothetical protein
MIDKSIIKENYSRMSDAQLIHLAENEGHDLTAEALAILQEEFSIRRLDMSAFGIIEDNKVAQKQSDIEKAQEKGTDEYMNSIWIYALEEKGEGRTDKEIHAAIIEKGLDEEQADMIIGSLESKAKEILSAHETNMMIGGFICIAGIVITLWSYSAAFAGSGGTYVITWGAVLFGAIRFFKGMSNKGKYKIILAKIQAKKNAGLTRLESSRKE